jgi:hypothetical protein
MNKRQHFKGSKRLRRWHRTGAEDRRFARTRLPDVGSGADPTAGVPIPVRRGPGGRYHRGETV